MDSHSKWLEVIHVNSLSSSTAISKLRYLFATHGLPDSIVSDNGATFTSEEFKTFLQKNQIRQILVAPYHPSSNGQAERMVASTKESLRRIVKGDWQTRVARFLYSQHTLPCSTTGKTPAELLMNRRLTSLLDRLHPDLNKTMRNKQHDIASTAQSQQAARTFSPNDSVFIRNYSTGPRWTPATILDVTGPLSYRTTSLDGNISRRHTDQIRPRLTTSTVTTPTLPLPTEDRQSNAPNTPEQPIINDHDDMTTSISNTPCAVAPIDDSPPTLTTPRRSQRPKMVPKYLGDYVHHLMREGVSCIDQMALPTLFRETTS